MSNLRQSLDSLLELQKIDSERDRLTRALRNLGTSADVVADAQAAQDAASSARAELARAAANQKDAELELSSIERKLKLNEDRVRSGAVTNPKELMNVEKEIGQLVRQRSALDDKILQLMDEVEALRIKQSEAEASASELEQRKIAALQDLAARRSQSESDLAAANARRIEAATLIEDKDLLKRYESIRARPSAAGIAIGRTQDNTCGSCHMQVSSIEANRAREGGQLIICDNCGRIMA